MKLNKILMCLVLFVFLIVPTIALDVSLQDQTSPALDLFFVQTIGVPTTVNDSVLVDWTSVNLTSVASCSVGDYFGMFNTEESRQFFGEILSITGNTLTIDTFFDYNFSEGDTAACFTRDLNVDGSVNPQIFSISVGPSSRVSIDITRIMIKVLTSNQGDLGDFGDISGGLNKGIILRRTDGDNRNIFNVKTNGELAHLMYDWTTYSATNPGQGVNGFLGRFTFAGQDKHGVAIRLEPGDSFDIIIQDDLSSLDSFRLIAEGHEVDDSPSQSTVPGGASMSGSLLYPIAMMLGVGLMVGFLLFVTFKLSDEHKYAKVLLLASAVIMMLLIPKAGLDMSKNCVVVLANESSSGVTTEYNYEEQCFETTDTTAKTFFKFVNRIFYVLTIYVFLYIIYIFTNGMKKFPEWLKKAMN